MASGNQLNKNRRAALKKALDFVADRALAELPLPKVVHPGKLSKEGLRRHAAMFRKSAQRRGEESGSDGEGEDREEEEEEEGYEDEEEEEDNEEEQAPSLSQRTRSAKRNAERNGKAKPAPAPHDDNEPEGIETDSDSDDSWHDPRGMGAQRVLDISDDSSSDEASPPMSKPHTRAAPRLLSLSSSSSSSSSASSGGELDGPPAIPKRGQNNNSSSKSNGTKRKAGKHEAEATRKRIRTIREDSKLTFTTREARKHEEQRQQRLNVDVKRDGKRHILNASARALLLIESLEKHVRELRKSHPAMTNRAVKAKAKELAEAEVEEKEPELELDPKLLARAKAHQVEGIQFMWDNLFEGVQRATTTNGMGCVLAHSMGLGKTFQAIALVATALSCAEISIHTALIVTPKNVLRNWEAEFRSWLSSTSLPVRVFILEDERSILGRVQFLRRWQEQGGVMLVSYTMFRDLSLHKNVKNAKQKEHLTECLQQPGADMVVLDEGHLVRNHKSGLNNTLAMVRTLRRVALTGSPLQNNLGEYYTMVNFVRENYLGTRAEFRNTIETPIRNGQAADSTEFDVRLMKRQSFVLHRLLDKIVHRKGFEVLQADLPQKHEYVLLVRLSPLQRRLYQRYLELRNSGELLDQRAGLFHAFQTLLKVWNHPAVLGLEAGNKELEGFIVDEEEAKSTDSESRGEGSKGEGKSGFEQDWWRRVVQREELFANNNSGKVLVLLEILRKSFAQGDRVLVFSQSLPCLDLIERTLQSLGPGLTKNATFQREWREGREYFRIDGSTSSQNRQDWIRRFNRGSSNTLVFLISTRAGSLGVNLVGANRVVVFDACWNPSHDLQALFRCFRYGQTKNVFVYRLLAAGTMEEKIYDRQVTKLGLSERVVEKNQVARLFTFADQEKLFELDDDPLPNPPGVEADGDQDLDDAGGEESKGTARFAVPKDKPPADDVLASVLIGQCKSWVLRYHEHDSLLQHVEQEDLSQEELEAAWQQHIEREEQADAIASGRLRVPNPYDQPLSAQHVLAAQQPVPRPVSEGLARIGQWPVVLRAKPLCEVVVWCQPEHETGVREFLGKQVAMLEVQRFEPKQPSEANVLLFPPNNNANSDSWGGFVGTVQFRGQAVIHLDQGGTKQLVVQAEGSSFLTGSLRSAAPAPGGDGKARGADRSSPASLPSVHTLPLFGAPGPFAGQGLPSFSAAFPGVSSAQVQRSAVGSPQATSFPMPTPWSR